MLQAEILAGYEHMQEYLTFTWNVTNQTSEYLNLQIYFDHPKYVSQVGTDELLLRLNDPMMLVSKTGKMIPESLRVLKRKIPAQNTNNITSE